MVDIKKMLPELRDQVKMLGEDLLQRATTETEIDRKLRDGYQIIKDGGRSSQGFEEWREDYLDQVAVAWVLACVFVRFIEDNGLLDECWLAGEGERRNLADGSYTLFFRQHPHETEREYLKFVFKEIGKIPAAKELFEEGKTALWAVDPSGDAARQLLNFFKEIDPEVGGLKRSFATKQAKTGPIVEVYEKLAPQAQFLGDLYQDLSEHARKKYALLQTPEFILQFILDRTLTPALDVFGLKNLRLIDPACGSGHFLLGAFDRLFLEWMKPQYGIDNPVVAAQNALDSIYGTDINPFAIAITRFRLLVAAIQACGIKRLHQQSYAWKLNLATGDSLLRGSRPSFGNNRSKLMIQGELQFEPDPILAIEDPAKANEILGKSFHVVVGNPPYIIVRDRAQNNAYRQLYSTCHQKYSLGVPFTQRFWELAIRQGELINETAEATSSAAGFIGMITANSFMKREFGKKLIEEFLPKTDLTHVIDTSGANIPGHTTSTVILFGRSRKPVENSVRAVLGIKGEAGSSDDPASGLVWQSILQQIDRAGSENAYVSTVDIPRTTFNSHPWSIGGGGAAELKEQIEDGASITLDSFASSIGFASFPGQDDVFLLDSTACRRKQFDAALIRQLVYGEALRDWVVDVSLAALAPYGKDCQLISHAPTALWAKHLWYYRTNLEGVISFGGRTRKELGDNWWGWYRWIPDKYRVRYSIAFAEVASHNHFILERGNAVFTQTAPIVKLPSTATEDDHLGLLGLLNSSTVGFWLMQVCQCKGDGERGMESERWFRSFQFNSTKVGMVPVPENRPLENARQLDSLARSYTRLLPEVAIQSATPTSELNLHSFNNATIIRAKMIALQEELDWECYRLYGLLSDELCHCSGDLPEVALGQRAFEIVMARQMNKGELHTTWFEKHGSKPIIEIPHHWPIQYQKLVERRIKVIETNKEIGLIEKPEYKRRWNTEPWAEQQERALKDWLLDRLESPRYWPNVELQSTARLADRASTDTEFMQVAALYRDRPDFDVAALVAELVEGESVPFLPVLRYKTTGLRKRVVWERTWDLQRQEDAGKSVGDIPVPPKYTTADFLKTDYWRLRGKLDVPKERWISYPHCSTENDPSLAVGWAGWNHLQQATALIAYYDARKRDGWTPQRLTPLLAGLDQLLPWIHQWHPEIEPGYTDTAGQGFQSMLEGDAHELGLTLDVIRQWTPPAKTTRGRGRKQ
ncbi:MAG: BREX-2 system adenine-specific DNA-methyltransferase PglX [Gemmataceae bacterium]